jgi:hypothetical protein
MGRHYPVSRSGNTDAIVSPGTLDGDVSRPRGTSGTDEATEEDRSRGRRLSKLEADGLALAQGWWRLVGTEEHGGRVEMTGRGAPTPSGSEGAHEQRLHAAYEGARSSARASRDHFVRTGTPRLSAHLATDAEA